MTSKVVWLTRNSFIGRSFVATECTQPLSVSNAVLKNGIAFTLELTTLTILHNFTTTDSLDNSPALGSGPLQNAWTNSSSGRESFHDRMNQHEHALSLDMPQAACMRHEDDFKRLRGACDIMARLRCLLDWPWSQGFTTQRRTWNNISELNVLTQLHAYTHIIAHTHTSSISLEWSFVKPFSASIYIKWRFVVTSNSSTLLTWWTCLSRIGVC